MRTRHRTHGVVLVAALALLAAMSSVVESPAGAARPAKGRPVRVGVAYDSAEISTAWDELAAAGIARAASDYKLTVFDGASVEGHHSVLTRLARRNLDLVLAVGFTYADAIASAAAGYPKTNFVIIDAFPAVSAPNLQDVLFAVNEGSFLVGAAAGLTSTSLKMGFLGGAQWHPMMEEFRSGFAAGVAHVAPSATVETAYVGSFTDPDSAYQMALDMYSSGIDVIYPPAGASIIGVALAARDFSAANHKVWMIGVDHDLYQQVDDSLKPFVLTSMVKQVDVVTYETIKAQVEGTFVGGVTVLDLAHAGVNYSTAGGFVDDIVPTLEQLRAAIIAGDIVMP